jgi:cobalamin biosynthesis protein CobT
VAATALKLRTVFVDNKRAKLQQGTRSGRVQSSRLASVAAGNANVFARQTVPGKRDYLVIASLDASGSTAARIGNDYGNERINDLIRKMGMTLGDLMFKLGVKSEMYAHTTIFITRRRGSRVDHEYAVGVEVIKEERDAWDMTAKARLVRVNPNGANLDGHALEYLRKRADRSSATQKVILYVTDGEMPADGGTYGEQLRILKREIKTCQQRGYHLVGIGIGTDSPRQHGLDTVQLNSTGDLPVLVRKLENLLGGAS